MDHASHPQRPDADIAAPNLPPAPAPKEPFLTLFEVLFAALFGVMAAVLTLTPPSLGMANNGDFRRVTTNMGVESIGFDSTASKETSIPSRDNVQRYRIIPNNHPDHLNKLSRIAVLMPIKVAKILNRFTSRDTFDLRWLTAIYVLIATGAMAIWMRATRPWPTWARVVLGLAYCYIFLDLGYLVYFGSFYTEPPSLLYLLLALGCLLNLRIGGRTNSPSGIGWVLAFFVFCTLFAGAKAQDVPLVFPLLLAGVLAVFWTHSRAIGMTSIALALISAALAFHSMHDYDINLRKQNSVNTVFNGLLIDSPDPRGDLRKLGLRPNWEAYTGKSQFLPDSPFKSEEFEREFYSRVTPDRIAVFYATHPLRLIKPLDTASANLFDIRIPYLGNFSHQANVAGKTIWDVHSPDALPDSMHWKWPLMQAFTSWSRVKASVVPGKTWFWLAAGLGMACIGYSQARRVQVAPNRVRGAAIVALAAIFLLVPLTCIAGDGTWEIRKHLFLGCVAFDLMILLLLESGLSLLKQNQDKQIPRQA